MNLPIRHQQNSRAPIVRLLLPWLAVVGWAVVIFYFSAQPSLGINWVLLDFILRKIAHMAEFGFLSFLIWRAVKQHGLNDTRALALAGAMALLYAFSDEYHQSFVFGRKGTVRDIGFDLAGIIAAAILIRMSRRSRRLNTAK